MKCEMEKSGTQHGLQRLIEVTVSGPLLALDFGHTQVGPGEQLLVERTVLYAAQKGIDGCHLILGRLPAIRDAQECRHAVCAPQVASLVAGEKTVACDAQVVLHQDGVRRHRLLVLELFLFVTRT